ncbi:Unknown protein [Striga hermonthica]|uniref:DUF4283 domain-containing protein n=1 Tax=Striga hermonthica TaxID=68872 RepID=A0A9N7MNK7_STRHE|nr:Unknown protein [Striga hermonthica]
MENDLANKLRKFALSEKEEEGIVISEEGIASSLQECVLSLMGKVYGEKKVNFHGLKATLGAIWITKQPFSIKSLGDNLFQFLFQCEEDKDKILQGKTWSFDDQYILLKQWHADKLNFTADDEVIKIWVQIHNMPLH